MFSRRRRRRPFGASGQTSKWERMMLFSGVIGGTCWRFCRATNGSEVKWRFCGATNGSEVKWRFCGSRASALIVDGVDGAPAGSEDTFRRNRGGDEGGGVDDGDKCIASRASTTSKRAADGTGRGLGDICGAINVSGVKLWFSYRNDPRERSKIIVTRLYKKHFSLFYFTPCGRSIDECRC